MFPIRAKTVLPVEKIVITSVAVRGQLGEMSVWVTNHDISADVASGNYNFRLTPRHWTKIYGHKLAASPRTYKMLDLASSPVVLEPGQVRLLYIHSTADSDDAIVYDNTDPLLRADTCPIRHEDNCIAIYSGKAHLSPTPFGQLPIWGWGNAWRDRREFVGQINYGTVYQLWNPERHRSFAGSNFASATTALLMLQRRTDSPLAVLPDECIYYILNMCRWDWFQDCALDLKRRQCLRKRLLRRQAAAAKAATDTAAVNAATPRCRARQVSDNVLDTVGNGDGSDDDDDDDYGSDDDIDDDDEDDDDVVMEVAAEDNNWSVELVRNQLAQQQEAAAAARVERDDADEDDDAESNDSDESAWERANGYRADSSRFVFRQVASDDEDDGTNDDNDGEQQQQQPWFGRRLVDRIVVARAVARGLGQGRNDRR